MHHRVKGKLSVSRVQGPFVMNTYEEIKQANIDFRSGKLGR